MESIRLWYNGKRDYKTGVKLYALFGKDLQLKRAFLEPESDYKRNKLIEELAKLIKPVKPIIRVTASQFERATREIGTDVKKNGTDVLKTVTSVPIPPKKIYEYRWSENPDEVERTIHARWKKLYVEMMDLVNRLGDVAREGAQEAPGARIANHVKDPIKEKEAGKMALRILDLDDQLEEIYAERNYYIEKGKELVQFPYGQPCQDPALIPKKLDNAMRYARENRDKLKKDPSNTAAAELLKKHEWFCDHYKKALKQK
jgi:hypothetical protein